MGKASCDKNRTHTVRGTGGFTLVELAVVLVVLAILATMAVMGLRGWQDYADFKRQNEDAQTIFSAAQIQLTQYGERGQLNALMDAVTDSGRADKSTYLLSEQKGLVDSEGHPYDGGDSALWQDGNRGSICFLKVDKGDYKVYVDELKERSLDEMKKLDSGQRAKKRRIRALYDLIDPYVSDKSMLDAAICIEFDPNPKVALVYSVLYNDRVDGFTYGEGDAGGRRTVSIKDRSRGERKKDGTGYYGAELLAKGTDTFLSRPVVTDVRLRNEDTLNLSWSTKEAAGGRDLTRLIYTIGLFCDGEGQGDEGERLMTVTLGSADVEDLDDVIHSGGGLVTCSVRYEETGVTREYGLPVVHDQAQDTLTVVLDGLDLSAGAGAGEAVLSGSASIRRLLGGITRGADPIYAGTIYASVTGSREGLYDLTVEKHSNSENPMFGGCRTLEDGTVVYTVENARHFNNIRYSEQDYTGGQRVRYQVTRDISWEYALNQGSVYEGGKPVWPEKDRVEEYYFRPLPFLRADSVLESEDAGRIRTLKRFRLDASCRDKDGGETAALGLVEENYGTIRSLVLEDVWVYGYGSGDENYAEAVGGFCGRNAGNIADLTVRGSDGEGGMSPDGHAAGAEGLYNRIQGFAHVGAFAGETRMSAGEAHLEHLVNRIPVTGRRDVGGIAGYLESTGGTVRVSGCENYGKAEAGEALGGEEACFFGGIAGRAVTAEEGGKTVRIEKCLNVPVRTQEELDRLLDQVEAGTDEALRGSFVGGIAGFVDGAELLECDTVRGEAQSPCFVAGRDFVGGIVGYYAGNGGKLAGGPSGSRSQADIIGRSYVGGIVGCSAAGTLDDSQEPYRVTLADRTSVEPAVVSGWINEGLVTATGNYAGGVAGYNGAAGLIEDSYSDVDYGSGAERLMEAGAGARFVGGVAGYNQGTVRGGTAEGVSVVSAVRGQDYVGGVVGFNDTGGTVEGYALKGGYVDGKHFVGGFAGLNVDPALFTGQVQSSPNRVTGEYFVGGILGGNIIPVSAASGTLKAEFETDNFLGTLTADQGAFAGGFIGYNRLLDDKILEASAEDNTPVGTGSQDGGGAKRPSEGVILESGAGEGRISLLLYQTNELCAGLERLPDREDVTEAAKALEQVTSDRFAGYENHTASMEITGGGAGSAGREQLGAIRASVYVGGVVGYNHPDTRLTVRNVENITPVEATGYIEQLEGDGKEVRRYSYAGGIIGKVEEHAVLDGCQNRDVGEVRAKGTYTGGLAEINYGTIRNCTAGTIGDGTGSFIGGIAGVNGSRTDQKGTVRGVIEDCALSGQVSGVSYVGGLAAENYGIIRYGGQGSGGKDPGNGGAQDGAQTGSAAVDGSGSYVGGLTGYAHKGGSIVLEENAVISVDVTGTADYVGGIAGVNEGSVSSADGKTMENSEGNTVIGHNYVGGFFGVQLEPESAVTLRGFINRAYVQAETGYAGGIAAVCGMAGAGGESKITVRDCENYGTVEVLSAADPDSLKGTGTSGTESPEVGDEAFLAAAGGITAVNYGTVRGCGSYGEVSAGEGGAGGIAAVNRHVIEECETGSDVLSGSLELTGDLYVGGIAAVNRDGARIEYCAVKNLVLTNQDGSESGYMGGIAAYNEQGARIYDCQVGLDFDARARYYQEADEARKYSGLSQEAAGYVSKGISAGAGYTLLNGSDTIGMSVALVSNAEDVSMGGVAGLNEGEIRGGNRDAGAEYSVAAAELRFSGESMNYFGNLGGIAGINGGTVSHYAFHGYIRGEANDPARTPGFDNSYDLEPTKSRIYGYGGLVGRNGSDLGESGAQVKDCALGMARVLGTGSASNRTNVGGAAGFNGIGASVTGIEFMPRKDLLDEEKLSEPGNRPFSYTLKTSPAQGVWQGTVWVQATTYGHVGGVAGYNHGTVSGINWTPDYETAREKAENSGEGYFPGGTYTDKELAEVDQSYGLITAQTGHVGGIVGFNRRSGLVSRAVTGRHWLVQASVQAQDNAAGGIIGYNISERDLEQCDNHATVVKMVGNAVGGMAGRQENATTSSWRFYDCRNYGSLYAAARAGGMVGNWKYRGGTMERCVNYGAVQASGDAVGGIVAMTYAVPSGETVNIIDCENHGPVGNGSNIPTGGIFGNTQAATARFYGCINTGMLKSSGRAAGILAQKTGTAKIERCRNYGGYEKAGSFAGITLETGAQVKDCFGVTGTWIDAPIGPTQMSEMSNVNKYSYYFSNDKSEPYFYKKGNLLRIVGGTGTDPSYAVDSSESRILADVGQYTWGDIEDTARKTDSSVSYRLCKGDISGGRGTEDGIDRYLFPGSGTAFLPAPQGLKTVEADGEYKAVWNAVDKADHYVLRCIYQIPGGQTVEKTYTAYASDCLVPISVDLDGVYAEGVRIAVQAWAGDHSSVFSEEISVAFGNRLPFPQIRWKLDGSGSGKYWVTLGNRGEYEDFVREHLLTEGASDGQVEAKLADITVHTTGLAGVSFSVKDGAAMGGGTVDGEGHRLFASGSTGNVTFGSYATYDAAGDGGDVKRSVRVLRESMCPPGAYYQKQGNPSGTREKFANVELEKTNSSDGVGFSGTTARELTYNGKLKRGGTAENNSWTLDYRTELMADDPQLKVPVAVSVSEQTKISTTSSESVPVRLADLPEDFLQKDPAAGLSGASVYRYQNLMVRTYPTKMANDVVYQGWNVGEDSYSGEELENLSVTDSGEIAHGTLAGSGLISSGLFSGRQVKAGYVIVWAGRDSDGNSRYKVYYNALLAMVEQDGDYSYDAAGTPAGWKYRDTTFMRCQVFYHFIDLEKELEQVQPVPVVYAAARYDGDAGMWTDGNYDGTDGFVLTWDQAASDGRPAYTAGEEALYRNASYRLTVTGEKSGDNGVSSTVLVNNEETVTADRSGAYGSYNTWQADPAKVKTWDYDRIVVTLTRLGTEGTDGILTRFPAVQRREYPMRRRLSQVKDVTIALKRDGNGVVLKDALDYVVSFTGIYPAGAGQGGAPAEELAALWHYQVQVTSLADEDPSPGTVKEVPKDVDHTDIRLDTFRRGEPVAVTVQAIARPDSTAFRDGLVSTERRMTVPERLLKPQMGRPSDTADDDNLTAPDKAETVGVEDFLAGCITLRMAKENYTSAKFDYQLAFELYDSREEAEAGAGPDSGRGLLPDKDRPASMDYDTREGYYEYTVRGLPADYAGKWLRVVMRSVGDSSISSVWTDEADEGNGDLEAEAYKVFQLPKVQVDPVKFMEPEPGTVEREYPILESGREDLPEGSFGTVTASQVVAEFQLVEHAGSYRITMVQTPQQADGRASGKQAADYLVTDVNEMALTRQDEDTYRLTYRSTEDGGALVSMTLKPGEDPRELPYKEAVRLTEGEEASGGASGTPGLEGAYYILTVGTVQLTRESLDGGEVHVRFVLPDCGDITDDTGASLGEQRRTEQLLVRSLTEQADGNYLDSRWAMLTWDEVGFTKADIIDGEEKAKVPQFIPDGTVPEAEPVTDINGVAYRLGLYGATRYTVSIRDGSGKELGEYGVPVYQNGAAGQPIGQYEQYVWFADGFAEYADQEVQIKFRSIFDPGDETGGLSGEYTGEQRVKLPKPEPQTAAEVLLRTSGETEYPVNLAGQAGRAFLRGLFGDGGTKAGTVTVRQKELVWEYDVTDAAVAGYGLTVDGTGLEGGCRLDVDLRRGLFGVMPGLEEYLQPGGKLLYSVSYDIDGELLLKLEAAERTASPSDAQEAGPVSDNRATTSDGRAEQPDNRATPSDNRATPSDNPGAAGKPGVLTLGCVLRAEYRAEEPGIIRFTLTLPELSYDYMPEELAELYREAFPEGLYQTETFRLVPVMASPLSSAEETVVDLTGRRGELEEED